MLAQIVAEVGQGKVEAAAARGLYELHCEKAQPVPACVVVVDAQR